MVGLLPATAKMAPRLTLGYRQAIAIQNSLLLSSGQILWGHEFHRSALTLASPHPLFTLSSWHGESPVYSEGWQYPLNLHASYLHLHFGGCLGVAQKFLRHSLDFSELVALD